MSFSMDDLTPEGRAGLEALRRKYRPLSRREREHARRTRTDLLRLARRRRRSVDRWLVWLEKRAKRTPRVTYEVVEVDEAAGTFKLGAVRRWWISWWEPCEDYRPARDHENAPPWWCSATRVEDDAIWSAICAVVDAYSEETARTQVSRFWDPAEWRFCERKADGWMPAPDRFPPRAP